MAAENEAAALERRVVFFSGRVQGVGFRATSAEVAAQFPITGWVRNLPNGEVELTVEGTSMALDSFLAALARRMQRYIAATQVVKGLATGEFDAFSIRR